MRKRCHAPMANVEMHADGMPISILDGPAPGDGFLDPLHPYHEAARDGVSCTLCHQIEDDGNLGTLKGFSGHFTIAEHEVPENRSAYGPVPWPRTNPMRAEASFTPTYAPHIAGSALCATCHNLKTPYVDARGETASGPPETEFPEQVPYTEWENSSFGPGGVSERNCQSCHMPPAEGVRLANRPRRLQRVDHFSRHVFVGANTTMLDILDRNRDELGVTATGFEEAIERNRDLLASAADIQVLDASLAADELLVRVKINNHSGHKLPTSFPSRRVWVHFVARGPKGEVLFESERLNPDGSIEGADADRDLSRYEPHHRVITEPGQVQVYVPVMGNTDGEVTYTLLRAAQFIKDNRLTPRGFLKERVPEDVRVAGRAAADRDFDDGSDIIEYRVSVRPGKYVDVEIDLNYQTVAPSFLRDLYLDDGLPEVARFREIFENGAIVAENIASTSLRVRR